MPPGAVSLDTARTGRAPSGRSGLGPPAPPLRGGGGRPRRGHYVDYPLVRGLVEAGCRYVQIDAPGYTAYVDPPSLATMRRRGEDPMANFARSLAADQAVLRGFEGVTFGIHLCRATSVACGTARGATTPSPSGCSASSGTTAFSWSTTAAGGELRAVALRREGAGRGAGSGEYQGARLETVDELRRRIDAASRYVPLEQLALSPQCGFASDVVGNLISEDDQKRKLALVVETARRVWGQ